MPMKSTRVLVRGLSVLKALNEQSPRSITELAIAAGISRGTTLRICETLRADGFIGRTIDKTYHLTDRVRLFDACFDDEEWISRLATPVVERFANTMIWPAGLATLASSGDKMHIRSDTDAKHTMHLTTGEITSQYYRPILGSSVGLVVLAFLSKPEQSTILDILAASSPFEEDRVAKMRTHIQGVLAKVRRQGFALKHATLAKISHLAVPVLDDSGKPVAALWVRYFSNAMEAKQAKLQLLNPMRRVSEEIARLRRDFLCAPNV